MKLPSDKFFLRLVSIMGATRREIEKIAELGYYPEAETPRALLDQPDFALALDLTRKPGVSPVAGG
jgi:hypothetical protein